MPEISLLMPTRGRKKLVERFISFLIKNTHQLDQVELILYVDEDDNDSHHIDFGPVNGTLIIGPRQTMGANNMACFKRAQGNIIILVNDDIVIQTPGWERRIQEVNQQFNDGIYLAYPNDLFKGVKHPTFPILSRKACEVLEQPFPEQYIGAFIDTHLFDVFKRLQTQNINRIMYLPEVIFEHLHYRTGKATFDATYRQRDRFADDGIFIALTSLRQQQAQRLVAAIHQQTLPTLVTETNTFNVNQHNPLTIFYKYTRLFLFDSGLKMQERLSLFIKFICRYFASLKCARWLINRA